MRFINPYEFAKSIEELGENCRYFADSMYDGQKDVRFNSIRIQTAPVTATLTHNGMYVNIGSGLVVQVFTGSV